MSPTPPRPAIHKFGGASLADARAIRHAVTIIRGRPRPVVIVVSALAGVTDMLLRVVDSATRGDAVHALALTTEFRQRYHDTVIALVPARHRRPLLQYVDAASDDLEELVRSLAVLREASARVRDHVVMRGERLSARLVAAALVAAGEDARLVDPVDVIQTEGPYGGATPDLAATRRAARAHLRPLLAAGAIPVVPGFIGRAPDGGAATLGRGGSDLTATLLAYALDAPDVTLWKDVPGLLTADPRIVPDARLLPLVHPREAAELAYFGAKVLHPRALLPLAGRRTPLWVRPFTDPGATGTEVSQRREKDAPPVRSLSAVRDLALVTVTGSGILGVPGISARTFGALQAAGLSVSMIAQASSEYTIDFTVPAASAREAVAVLRHTFRAELAQGELEGITARPGVALVAVVGLAMAGHPGIAARVFDALAEAEVNVVAIAQGSGEHNISVAVAETSVPAALQRIHAAFQLAKEGGGRPRSRRGRDVVLLGAGTIGRAVLELVAASPARFRQLRFVAVIDRGGMLDLPEGLDARTIRQLLAHKAGGGTVGDLPGGRHTTPAEAVAALGRRALLHPVLVDATADDTTVLLTHAADAGFDVVLANKRPLTAPWAQTTALREALARREGHLRHEATVGAGLPFIIAANQLVATGDHVRRLEGCLSGTLGLVLSALDDGIPFSVAVADALTRGVTEPDPRDDLSGIDVARKALILARLLGQQRDMDSIAVESLVRRQVRGPVATWLATLAQDDAWWAARVADASARGAVLRYVASITPTRVTVGLREMPRTHPLGQLRGGANQLVITSERYEESPLVITGPGAGPAVTATGVLADLLALAGL
jgi:aspartokinase/homoserine dehydrogenase 1